MNRPDDFDDADLDLQRRLDALLADEPPMHALPDDDLTRGRRLVRRRRWGAVGTAAVLVPALALGATAVSGNLFAGSGGGTKLVPEQGGGSEDPSINSDLPVLCASVPGVVSPDGQASPEVGTDGDSSTNGGTSNSNSGQGSVEAGQDDGDPNTSVTCVLGNTDHGGWDFDPVCKDDPSQCEDAYVTDPEQDAAMTRLDQLLVDTLDPDGSHTDGSSIGGAGASAMAGGVNGATGGGAEGDTFVAQTLMVGRAWSDGGGEGAVMLTVVTAGSPDVKDGCANAMLTDGPTVTCEDVTLADGTHVLVGHADQDGAERLVVAYARPDGSLAIATADEASTDWWSDGSGTGPLDHLPVTQDQLVELVTAPGAHI